MPIWAGTDRRSVCAVMFGLFNSVYLWSGEPDRRVLHRDLEHPNTRVGALIEDFE